MVSQLDRKDEVRLDFNYETNKRRDFKINFFFSIFIF